MQSIKKKIENIEDNLSKEEFFDLWIETCKAVARKELPEQSIYGLAKKMPVEHHYYFLRMLLDRFAENVRLLLLAYYEEKKAGRSYLYQYMKLASLSNLLSEKDKIEALKLCDICREKTKKGFGIDLQEGYVSDEKYIEEFEERLGIRKQ